MTATEGPFDARPENEGAERSSLRDSRARERAAARAFARRIETEGWPDWGIRCKHGIQGGLHCEWCGNPDRLPPDQKLSGVPRRA